MTLALILALLALCGLTFELFRVRSTYSAMYDILLRDRDDARKEVATTRAALFPQLARQPQQKPAVKAGPDQVVPGFNPRMPTRLRLKALTRMFNSKQQGIDRIAANLPPQPAAKE